MFRQIGPTEILVVLAIVVLLFGGKKLPELARGAGRGLRIFKSEVKGDGSDDDDDHKPEALEAQAPKAQPLEAHAEHAEAPRKQPEQG